MNYEKKYNEVLERAKVFKEHLLEINDEMDYIFPELKESEDEKVRKTLIAIFKGKIPYTSEEDAKRYIAWLEKQGEQKPYGQRKKCFDCQFNYAGECKGFCQMKRDEQIHADKTEPKFHEGDWVVSPNNLTFKITHANSHSYTLHLYNDDYRIFESERWYIDKKYHLWTIRGAKPGDVLASELCDSIILFKGIKDGNIDFYCDYDFSEINVSGNRFSVNTGQYYGSVDDSEDFHPATKEQRDTLMKAMEEAGYKWNEEKKELEMIIDEKQIKKNLQDNSFRRMFEQKPIWGEEDKEMIDNIIDYMQPMPIFFESTKGKSGKEYTKEFVKNATKWLKSLKNKVAPQKQWKPSEEQMQVLKEACDKHWEPDGLDPLYTLYDQLKKL